MTKYKDINEILHSLITEMAYILGENLVGVYLTGSLSYGDFNSENSDIDLLTILTSPASQEKLESLRQMHLHVERDNEKWTKRIECSYISMDMLESTLPPKTPRPYINEGIFYTEAPYGNEWIINQYLLYKYGITLVGPDFKTLVKPIFMEDVQEACIRGLFEEWQSKTTDPTYLKNSHNQSYVVLNMCRILYTVIRHSTATKKASASWVKHKFGPRWCKLIETAESWQYGKEMNLPEDTIEFIEFVIDKVKEI